MDFFQSPRSSEWRKKILTPNFFLLVHAEKNISHKTQKEKCCYLLLLIMANWVWKWGVRFTNRHRCHIANEKCQGHAHSPDSSMVRTLLQDVRRLLSSEEGHKCSLPVSQDSAMKTQHRDWNHSVTLLRDCFKSVGYKIVLSRPMDIYTHYLFPRLPAPLSGASHPWTQSEKPKVCFRNGKPSHSDILKMLPHLFFSCNWIKFFSKFGWLFPVNFLQYFHLFPPAGKAEEERNCWKLLQKSLAA